MKCVAIHEGKLTVGATSRNHNVSMDMPSPIGQNKAMTPGEMLLSSIAGCKIISFSSLAKKSSINFDELTVEISGGIGGSGFIDGTKIPTKEIVSIHTTYKIKTTNTRDELEEFLVIVDKACTVAKAISQDIKSTNEVIML
ncbi:MAG: OsmC family protein [Clostridium sp.]